MKTTFSDGTKKHYYDGPNGKPSTFSLSGEAKSLAEFLALPALIVGGVAVAQGVITAKHALEHKDSRNEHVRPASHAKLPDSHVSNRVKVPTHEEAVDIMAKVHSQ